MKILKKILILLIITVISIMINNCNVSADPGSSKGFAEYDDTQAAQESKKETEEQKNKYDAEKSTNNYLENLQVEGYKISPEFDKQTLEYTINEEITSKEINIKSTASDSKSKVEGTGKIKLGDNQNQCRIDVTSESGTVRTYIIKLKRAETVEEDNKIQENENAIVEEYSQKKEDNAKQEKKIFLILGIVLLVIFAMIIIKLFSIKKGKHQK